MSGEKVCKFCKYWDLDAKFRLGMGGSGCVHCSFNGDRGPYESCSRWEFAYDRTEDELARLKKYYDIY